MHLGTVSRFNEQRSFGFILADTDIDGIVDREIYFHRSGLPRGVRSLERGQRVEFVTKPAHVAGKPPQAKIIRVLDAADVALPA